MPAMKEEQSEAFCNATGAVSSRVYSEKTAPSLKSLSNLCSQHVNRDNYPLAECYTANIPIYNLSGISPSAAGIVSALQDEWNHILLSGPGVVILRSFCNEPTLIDDVNDVFASIIASENSGTQIKKGDHFAASGLNSRIWNSFQKHALNDPNSFTKYYSNPWLQIVSESWLGPAYQITAQVNIVHPGGKPQVAHRDYHLGFQTASSCARFPKSMQIASQLLTLQGAIVHSDMPLASGPTRFLPFSQQFEPGYMAYRRPEFTEYFNNHWVSAELKKGDAVFFNPALMHAAGQNDTTDVMRSANLLQISSAFGRTMEHIDTLKIIDAVWEDMTAKYRAEGFSQEVEALIGAVAEGYPFPTNLDNRPPAPGGMAPASEQDFVRDGLSTGMGREEIIANLTKLRADASG